MIKKKAKNVFFFNREILIYSFSSYFLSKESSLQGFRKFFDLFQSFFRWTGFTQQSHVCTPDNHTISPPSSYLQSQRNCVRTQVDFNRKKQIMLWVLHLFYMLRFRDAKADSHRLASSLYAKGKSVIHLIELISDQTDIDSKSLTSLMSVSNCWTRELTSDRAPVTPTELTCSRRMIR